MVEPKGQHRRDEAFDLASFFRESIKTLGVTAQVDRPKGRCFITLSVKSVSSVVEIVLASRSLTTDYTDATDKAGEACP
jgi:hypothetical protein